MLMQFENTKTQIKNAAYVVVAILDIAELADLSQQNIPTIVYCQEAHTNVSTYKLLKILSITKCCLRQVKTTWQYLVSS